MKTALPWVIVGILVLALVVLLMGTVGGGEVPAGQAANTRCSGLIVLNSCNVHMEQVQPEKPKQELNPLVAIAGIVLVGIATFGVGALLTRDNFYSEMEKAYNS